MEKKLYVLMISVHGLLRARNWELGRDADTGGQIKYVAELADNLGRQEEIERVDLVTQKIEDPKVDKIYSQEEEKINDKAQIIRVPCGPKRYLRKEVLWPYLDIFSDLIVQHIRKIGKIPDVIHGHYADAGYVGSQLARLFGVPFIFTGHSLGRVKKERLLANNVKLEKIRERYNIETRIEAEEIALDTASFVIASTQQEVEEQYKRYENYSPERMEVMPPGVDLRVFSPPEKNSSLSAIGKEISRFLREVDKPAILAMSRADEKKNIETLVHAYGKNPQLQEKANLVIIAGNRDDIRQMDPGPKKVLFNILHLMDKYDLYGKMAIPKHHSPPDVPDIYRFASQRKGVFVNPALTEPFGLTLLEASATGLPIVATNDGGPQNILKYCENGYLVDPQNDQEIAEKIDKVLAKKKTWKKFSENGVNKVAKYFSWAAHCQSYIAKISELRNKKYYQSDSVVKSTQKLTKINKIVITDVDDALLGDQSALEKLVHVLQDSEENVSFGIATGRHLESAKKALQEAGVPTPDIFITSVGTEIYYGEKLVADEAWHNHINYYWKPQAIKKVMSQLPGVELQDKEHQQKFKLSYHLDPDKAPNKQEIVRKLRKKDLKVKVVYSHDAFLDLLPLRASKGLAVRYLTYKWGIPPENILVAGSSGNDEEMLKGSVLGVVVANYSSEIKNLKGRPRIYFAKESHAAGILEGIEHYEFLKD